MSKSFSLIIFTDLDGSLLHRDNFKFDKIKGYVKNLIDNGIVIIPNTSKTENEIEEFIKELGSNIPFSSICILYLSLIFWTLAYDTIYATQDEKEDKNLNLYSSTLLFGSKKVIFLNIMIITKYCFIIFYGSGLDFGFIFNILVLTISIINLIDLNIIWKNKPENASSYFSRNNYYGISLLFSIIIGSHFNV